MVQSALEAQKVIGQVSAQAIVDEAFRQRLTAEPTTVLREYGLELPADMPELRVEFVDSYDKLPVESSPDALYLVVPNVEELSHEELAMVAGAASSCQSTASTACTIPSCGSSSSTASTNSCA